MVGAYARVADGSHRRYIGEHGGFARKALAEHSPEASLAISVLIAVEVIPSHLVNHYAHHQFGTIGNILVVVPVHHLATA